MDEVPPVERSDTRRTLVTSIVRLDHKLTRHPKSFVTARRRSPCSMNILLPIGRICPNILFGWLRLAAVGLVFSIAGIYRGMDKARPEDENTSRKGSKEQKAIDGQDVSYNPSSFGFSSRTRLQKILEDTEKN